jgi:hypothetical protein
MPISSSDYLTNEVNHANPTSPTYPSGSPCLPRLHTTVLTPPAHRQGPGLAVIIKVEFVLIFFSPFLPHLILKMFMLFSL